MNLGSINEFLYIFHTKDLNLDDMEDAGKKVAVIRSGAIGFEIVDILKSNTNN